MNDEHGYDTNTTTILPRHEVTIMSGMKIRNISTRCSGMIDTDRGGRWMLIAFDEVAATNLKRIKDINEWTMRISAIARIQADANRFFPSGSK